MPLSPDTLVPWIERFLHVDHEATVHNAPERRAASCSAEVAEGLASLALPEAPIITRRLFKLEYHGQPEGNPWVAAHVSEATGARRGAGKYHLLLVIRAHLGSPRITGVYDVCTACVALGVDGQGDQCIECEGGGWEHWFGEGVNEDLETVRAIHAVKRPSTPLYHSAWKRGVTEPHG